MKVFFLDGKMNFKQKIAKDAKQGIYAQISHRNDSPCR